MIEKSFVKLVKKKVGIIQISLSEGGEYVCYLEAVKQQLQVALVLDLWAFALVTEKIGKQLLISEVI